MSSITENLGKQWELEAEIRRGETLIHKLLEDGENEKAEILTMVVDLARQCLEELREEEMEL